MGRKPGLKNSGAEATDAQKDFKQSRAKRPNQGAPNRANRATKSNGNVVSRALRDPEEESNEELNGSPVDAASWSATRDSNAVEYFAAFSANSQRSADRQRREQQRLQQDVSAVAARLFCCSGNCCDLVLKEERVVTVFCLDSVFEIRVPRKRCSACDQTIHVHPYHVGCTRTTATPDAMTWVAIDLIHFARSLIQSGTSATAICDAVTHTIRKYNPEANNINGNYCVLKSQDLHTAFREYLKVESGAVSSTKPESDDPFFECLVCTNDRSDSTLQSVPSVPLVVAADAAVKPSRYASAGQSQKNIKPSTNTYIGEADQEVAELIADKEKFVSLTAQRRTDANTASGSNSCTVDLKCSRDHAGKMERFARNGLVAFVCPHGFPGRGLVVGLKTPEQHVYYDVLLESLLRRRPDLKILYVDIGCRYIKGWTPQMERLIDAGILSEAVRQLLILVNFFHANSHDTLCQLKFNGLFQNGVGRRGGGEQVERFWSRLRALAVNFRYMSEANWIDSYNLVFEHLVTEQQHEWAHALKTRIGSNIAKMKEVDKSLDKLKVEAHGEGVTDLELALESLVEYEAEEVEKLSKPAMYVQTLMMLRSHEAVSDNAAAIAMMPRHTGDAIHNRSVSDKVKAELQNKVNVLEMELGIDPEKPWEEEDEEYKDALRELKKHEIAVLQHQAEETSFRYNMLFLELTDLRGKEKDSLIAVRERVKGQLVTCLQKIATWKALGTGVSRLPVNEAAIENACGQKFDWNLNVAEGQQQPSSALSRYYATQYRVAKAQFERTQEETEFLEIEIALSYAWLEDRLAFVGESLNSVTTEAAVPRVKSGYPGRSDEFIVKKAEEVAEGQKVLLRREKAWLEYTTAEMIKKGL